MMSADEVVREERHDTEALNQRLRDKLAGYREAAKQDPTFNPIGQLGLDVSRLLASGEVQGAELSDLIQFHTKRAFLGRADRLARYLGELDFEANEDLLRDHIRGAAYGGDGQLIEFGDFAALMARELIGIVITAHPTFGLSAELYSLLAQLCSGVNADGTELSEAQLAQAREKVGKLVHCPDDTIDLRQEQALALSAIKNIQLAVRRVYRLLFEVARELYPDCWRSLKPRLLTVASWVGYDLDGRSDVLWSDTFRCRMEVEVEQLKIYLGRIRELVEEHHDAVAGLPVAKANLDLIEEKMRTTDYAASSDLELLGVGAESVEEVQRLGVQLLRSLDVRLIDTFSAVEKLTEVIEQSDDTGFVADLCILRAEMSNYGLGLAHTHVRLNATQLHNAVRVQLGMEGSPDEAGNRRRNFNDLDELFDNLEPVTINFGSVMAERTSAKRLFMVVAQMLKYIDRTQPVRFLIAECDNPFTILAALFFARMFGVEDKVDISPLFETDRALERAETVIGKLLGNEHYRAYVEKRGRICLQTGFSDAGRHLGQTAACMAIERLRMKMARMLSAYEMKGIELLIFDTHGESMGRGAHPVSFEDRLNYVSSPKSRTVFEEADVKFKQELSFQGGDGYVFFANEKMAFATVCRLLSNVISRQESHESDAFYLDTDSSLDFFITAKDFNASVMNDPNYATLLDSFGTNLLYRTGSRMSRRQHDGPGVVRYNHPSQIRAIPHNATLQQLGFMANSVGGLGTAIANDIDQFGTMYRGSDRCRRFMSLAAFARSMSGLDVLGAYLEVFNPNYWLQRAEREDDPKRYRRYRRLVGQLDGRRYERLQRIMRRFREDVMDFDAGLSSVDSAPEKMSDELAILHALRIGMIQELFVLAVRIPRFSSQSNVTVGALVQDLLQLNVLASMEVLEQAFPADGRPPEDGAFGERASYVSDEAQGYAEVHRDIFEPMSELYDLMRRVTTGVSHIIGAFG